MSVAFDWASWESAGRPAEYAPHNVAVYELPDTIATYAREMVTTAASLLDIPPWVTSIQLSTGETYGDVLKRGADDFMRAGVAERGRMLSVAEDVSNEFIDAEVAKRLPHETAKSLTRKRADREADALLDTEGERPRLWAANDLRPAVAPRWLAQGRIPRAAISLLVGDEGIGKSLAWVWVTAAVTTGKALSEFGIPARDPENVIVVITEDDWSGTVRPRLEVAGADMDRIVVVCTDDDGSGAPVFPRDIELINAAEPAPGLVVVDAWLDTVPARMSVRDPQQARQALHPWKELATTTGAAVWLLTHTNRVASASGRDKYGGTAELRKKARMSLFAQRVEGDLLAIGPEKSNGSKPLPVTQFDIEAVQFFPPSDDGDGKVPRLRFVGQGDRTAAELIGDEFNGEAPVDRDDLDGADLWLFDYLTQAGAPVPSKDAKAAARSEGIPERTLKRATQRVGVVVASEGYPRRTTWTTLAIASRFGGES